MIAFPESLERTLVTRWPDYLDIEGIRHSDSTYTLVLLDLDYRYYTFRANLSLDGRWTVIPISGFESSVWSWE